LLQAINITMQFGSRKLFDKINIRLNKGKRYGLIGANGAGKTTFLKIISREMEPTDGEIWTESGAKIGVLGQNQFAFEDFTLFDAVLWGNKRLFDAVKEKEKLYAEGDFSDDKVNERLGELEMICAEEDPTYEYDVNIEKILEELGFDSTIHHSKMSEITSGEKFKVLLAQVLFPKPEILFLDEPTNNLDIKAIGWLEEKLKRHEGTMIVISHDRHFINSVVTHILDVDFGTIREFSGNYDDWYIAANLIQKQMEVEREKKLGEKEELENFIRRFSANASKAKQATSRQKQLEKIQIDDFKPSSRRDPSIVFKPKREIGNDCLIAEGITFGYEGEEKLLKNFSLSVLKNDKIALIGQNGIGKTTILKILMGELTPESGTVKWGATVQTGYFPQDTTDLVQGEETLYEWLRSYDRKAELGEIRNCLGRMLFNGAEQEKAVSSISGGEKHRIMLSKLMLEGPNFLVMDEPNNHLDLEAIIALGESLYEYTGAAICVTHDRELIDAFANRIIELKPNNEIIDFRGTYEEYLENKN